MASHPVSPSDLRFRSRRLPPRPLFPCNHPNYAGDFGVGPNPKLLARVKLADLVLLSADGSAKCPRRATRVRYSRAADPSSCTCIPAPRSSAACIIRISRSMPRRPLLRGAAKIAAADGIPGAANETAHAEYLAWGRNHAGARRRQPRRGHGVAARESARRCIVTRAPEISPAGASLLPSRDSAGSSARLRRDGLWRAGRFSQETLIPTARPSASLATAIS